MFTDHLGSPRLVVDTTTSTIAQRLDYDTWGNVQIDSNPGFQPFGFAGGLQDRETNQIRYGSRDYDALTGRWTEQDKIGFFAGASNLYVYASSDPVNYIDSDGMDRKSCPTLREFKYEDSEKETLREHDGYFLGKKILKIKKTYETLKEYKEGGADEVIKKIMKPEPLKEYQSRVEDAMKSKSFVEKFGDQMVDLWERATDAFVDDSPPKPNKASNEPST